MTYLQELFFRLVSSDAVLQMQFFRRSFSRCFKLQINSFALELVQSESLRIVLWLLILHTWTNCLAYPTDYFDTLLLSKFNRWLVKHACSNKIIFQPYTLISTLCPSLFIWARDSMISHPRCLNGVSKP